MKFSPEILDQLASSIGIFRPNGLNDDRRLDMTDQPFMAIDGFVVHEVDDAVRVKRHRGGRFLVEVAVADGAQVAGNEDMIAAAIETCETKYSWWGNKIKKRMLPYGVVSELELRDGSKRAMVVSQTFDSIGEPEMAAEISPALVTVDLLPHHRVSARVLRGEKDCETDGIFEFNKVYRNLRGMEHQTPQQLQEAGEPITRYAERLVETYMVLANLAVAHWAKQRAVPILHRTFKRKVITPEHGSDKTSRAMYEADDNAHDGIAQFTANPTGYTRYTSPLRRACDLINHLQVAAELAGQPHPYTYSEITDISHKLNNGFRKQQSK